MKITEETKIKDLIPEGYAPELSSDGKLVVGYADSSNTSKIIVIQIHKKKKVKDFNWYVNRYFHELLNDKTILTMNNHVSNINIKNYDGINFEFKIGLLKFICDDLKLNILDYVHGLYVSRIENIAVTNAIKSICPAEFLNSIFK